MKTKNKNGEIALVDKLEKLKPNVNYSSHSLEIRVTIASLSEKDTPQNFSIKYDMAKSSVGGCSARIFASDSSYSEKYDANLFGWYGPEISYGVLRDYQHGERAVRRIDKRLEEIYRLRGCVVDAAESMGRFLEACDIDEVYMRPDSSTNCSWLSEGEWRKRTIGEFVGLVRSNLYWVDPKPRQIETTITPVEEEVLA